MPRIKPPNEGCVYVGIDPGKKGAVCLYDFTLGKPSLDFIDWPKDDNIRPIFRKLTFKYDSGFIINIILEKVNAMPKQGVTSMFSFGRNYGQWLATLQIIGLSYNLMTPQQWRKGIVFPSDGDKKQAAFKAFQRLFPDQIEMVKGAKGAIKDGRIDAALMAYKAYLMHGRK